MRTRIAAVLIVLAVVVVGFAAWRYSRLTHRRSPSFVDVDRDFEAVIASTRAPLTFVVSVQQVNGRADKWIREPSYSSQLIVKDSSGRVIPEIDENRQEWTPLGSGRTWAKWRARIKGHLAPGRYLIVPKARVSEAGKDAVFSITRNRQGRIASDFYPAACAPANSIWIVVK